MQAEHHLSTTISPPTLLYMEALHQYSFPRLIHLYNQDYISYQIFYRLIWTKTNLIHQIKRLNSLHTIGMHGATGALNTFYTLQHGLQDLEEDFKSWGVDDLSHAYWQQNGHMEEFGDAMTEWESFVILAITTAMNI